MHASSEETQKSDVHLRQDRYFRTVIAVALFASATVLAAWTGTSRGATPPQEPTPGQSRSPGENQKGVISTESNVVNVDVVVTDQDGRVLNALKKENFRILDNGKPQVITNFAPASAPITIAVLMEYSGAAYNYFAYKAAGWSPGLLDRLEPQDWIALVTYDLKPTIQVDFTRNKS